MAASRDSTVIKEIKNVKSFTEKISDLRGCYQFLEDKPARAKNFISQANQGSNGFMYIGLPGETHDEESSIREVKAIDTMRELEFLLKERRKAWTVKELKALIPELILKLEYSLDLAKGSLSTQIALELKPREPGFDIGFVRNKKKTPFTGKAEKIIEQVVKATLKELLGDVEDRYFQVDYSEILDLENIEEKISPRLREFLKCKTPIEGIDFIEDHPELLKVKYLCDIYEQCYRYCFKGMLQKAKSLSFSFYVLKYAGFLKEHALDFFCKPENASPGSEVAQLLYETVKVQGSKIKENYISNFQYQFRAIPSYEFVASVPIETEKNYSRFMQLGEELRKALIEGTFEAVDKALRQMSSAERKKSLTICAIGGFFYFKRMIKPAQFGVMSQAVKRAIDKLA